MRASHAGRVLLLALIRAYQRHVSPRKGFGCAYRAHTGRASCSALGLRAVRRHGVFAGLALVRERTYRCGVAHRRCSKPKRPAMAGQRGFCDCDLPCDLSVADACALGDGCGDCDWPRKREKTADDPSVHIPPRAGRSGRA